MSENSSPKTSLRSRSSASMIRHYPRIGRRKIMPGIPKAAHWGWGHLPLPAKIMVAGVLCGAISLTTPYWAYIKAEEFGLSTFGLWHYCSGDVCNSIHDNLVEGRSVEAWFHFTQGSMSIGVACSIVSLAMLTNSIEGRKLRMTITVHAAVSCILAISALEHFVALSIFASYLESSGFLFTSYGLHKIDFYGSYYLGIISLVCSLVSAFVVYLNRSATRRNKPKQSCEFDFSNPEHLKLLWEFYQQQGYFQGSNGDLGHGEGLETDPLLPTGMLPHRSEEESLGYDNGGYEELHDMERTAHGGWYRSPPNVAS